MFLIPPKLNWKSFRGAVHIQESEPTIKLENPFGKSQINKPHLSMKWVTTTEGKLEAQWLKEQ